MIGPFVEIRRDYTISFGSRVSLAGLAVCLVALFLTVDREQHEVIEAVVTVVSVFAEVKIKPLHLLAARVRCSSSERELAYTRPPDAR
jgi:hypothetical protein